MNARKEYPTFEELWTCCAQEESRFSAKEKFQRKDDDQTSQQSSINSGIRRSLTQGRNQIKKRICQKYNASTVENMVSTRIIVLNPQKKGNTRINSF
jgi:hypothetical protein